MNINVYSIAKEQKNLYEDIVKELSKMVGKYAKLEDKNIFNSKIATAQTIGKEKSQEAYTQSFEPFLNKGYNIALHPDAKELDSFEFSKLLSDRMSVQFFIGGAYGLESSFLTSCDRVVSLSKLTLSHKVAKVVLFEQIFRGLSILNNHPYHK